MGTFQPTKSTTHAKDAPVRLMKDTDEDRRKVCDFLHKIDYDFIPPLSDTSRYGSIEEYLKSILSNGKGKVLVAEKGDRVIGVLGYKFEGDHDERVHLVVAGVDKEERGAPWFYRLMQSMVKTENDTPIETVWGRTWESNTQMRKILGKIGLNEKTEERKVGDFGGLRTTMFYEGPWESLKKYFMRTIEEITKDANLPEIRPPDRLAANR